MRFNLFTTALLAAVFMSETVQSINIADDNDNADVCMAEIEIAIEADKDVDKLVD